MPYHPRPTIYEPLTDTEEQDGVSPVRYCNLRDLVKNPTCLRVLEDIPLEYNSNEPVWHGHKALSGLKRNEILEVVERWHDDFWLVMCVDDRIGFIRMDHRVSFLLTSRVRALWGREKEQRTEMAFQAGAEMDLLYPHDEIWVWAMSNSGGDVGLIPFSFIECISPETTGSSSWISTPEKPYGDLEWVPSEVINARREKVRALWPYSEENTRFLNLKKNDIVEILAQPLEHWWIGVIFSTTGEGASIVESIGLFPKNYVHDSLTRTPSPISGRTLLRPPWYPYYVRVIFSREPEHTYELEIVKGDIIEVETISPDRWWRGRSRSGNAGWLPENYVSPVLSRFYPIRDTLMQ